MTNSAKLGLAAVAAVALALAVVSLAPVPPPAGAVEGSVTVRRQHRECGRHVWQLMESRARERASVFCEARGGVDDETLRWVHHDSARGAEQLCVVHLHYACNGELVTDAR